MHKHVGRNIKAARVMKGMSQEDLCGKIHLSRSTLSKIESGNFTPRFDTMINISKVLGQSLDWFATEH